MYSLPILIEPHYFPPIPVFMALDQAEAIFLEVHSRYEKQTYQNRCYLLNKEGVHKLVVPVCHPVTGQPYHNILIDYTSPWYQRHWRTLAAAYGKTPYWEALAPLIEPVLFAKHRYLVDLNQALLEKLFGFLQRTQPISRTTTYIAKPGDPMHDLRNLYHPKTHPNPLHAPLPVYTQRFPHAANPQVSILDLLFNDMNVLR